MSDTPCSVGDCGRPARRAGLCWGHIKRRQLGLPVEVELKEPKGAPRDRAGLPRRPRSVQLVDAAIDLADANTGGEETEYARAEHRLVVAASRLQPRPETPLGPVRPRGRPRGGASRMTQWRRRQGR